MTATISQPEMIIRPSKGFLRLNLKDVWAYAELLYFLTWRDIKVRYKQTALGAAWAIIQPVMTMIVFSMFFGKHVTLPNGVPYRIYAFAALVPWFFFAHGLIQSSNSLVGSANLIKKVYFPRLAIPIATVLAGVVDFLIALAMLFVLMTFYLVRPGIHVF